MYACPMDYLEMHKSDGNYMGFTYFFKSLYLKQYQSIMSWYAFGDKCGYPVKLICRARFWCF